MHVRRSAAGAALAVALTSTGALAALPAYAAPDQPAAQTATPKTGRLITSDRPGIVLVDESGKHSKVLYYTPRKQKADLESINVRTGTYLWSTGSGKKTWRISTLYGEQIGTFSVPKNVGTPAIDSGGYEYWWVQPSTGTAPAQLKAYEFQDKLATPRTVRDLPTGSADGLWLSPDDQWVAAEVTGPAGTSLHLVSTDGKTDHVVPVPAGTTLTGGRVVWSPDSGSVAFTAGMPGAATARVYVAPVAGDYAPVALAAQVPALYDWSPDGATLLTGTPGKRTLVEVSATTGATVATHNIKHNPADSAVLWTGLKAGANPVDTIRPTLGISQPKCPKSGSCATYRHSVKAWRTIRGPVSDKGGSQLRYVALTVFQKRADGWWGLAGHGVHPVWTKFPNYVEARYDSRERNAQVIGKHYELKIPDLKAGKLYIVAKARDGAGHDTARKLQVELH
jgi:hypothetical protein